MKIKEALRQIDKPRLIKNLMDKKDYKRITIERAFARESISKSMAPDIEEFTSISALFWMRPDLYNIKGERIK